MKTFFYLLFFSCGGLCYATFSNPTLLVPQSSLKQVYTPMSTEDEIKIVELLIETTQKQIDSQKHLKELMFHFQKQREGFVQGNQTKSHSARMVRTARQIYEMIAASHIEHLFAKDYLDELSFFSSIAGKSALIHP